jgi:hypothetical protein
MDTARIASTVRKRVWGCRACPEELDETEEEVEIRGEAYAVQSVRGSVGTVVVVVVGVVAVGRSAFPAPISSSKG